MSEDWEPLLALFLRRREVHSRLRQEESVYPLVFKVHDRVTTPTLTPAPVPVPDHPDSVFN